MSNAFFAQAGLAGKIPATLDLQKHDSGEEQANSQAA
tara:strand:+ start:579 stop:689 length:111 start_codon:yes stop_codon:yes gene_type:complete